MSKVDYLSVFEYTNTEDLLKVKNRIVTWCGYPVTILGLSDNDSDPVLLTLVETPEGKIYKRYDTEGNLLSDPNNADYKLYVDSRSINAIVVVGRSKLSDEYKSWLFTETSESEVKSRMKELATDCEFIKIRLNDK